MAMIKQSATLPVFPSQDNFYLWRVKIWACRGNKASFLPARGGDGGLSLSLSSLTLTEPVKLPQYDVPPVAAVIEDKSPPSSLLTQACPKSRFASRSQTRMHMSLVAISKKK